MRASAFAIDPRMPAPFAVEGSGAVVPFERVRITLQRSDLSFALDTVANFPASAAEIALTLDVLLPFGTTEAGVPLTLRMQYINAQGDTVFRAGPLPVTAVPTRAGETPLPVTFDVTYVGVGANATSVVLSPPAAVVVSGTTTAFTAVALDGQGQPVVGTPIIFSSPDAASVQISPVGLATWLPVRGAARVIATLPTGADADTITYTVALPATKLAIVSGNAQSAVVGTALSAPVTLRVTAADDVPVEGVIVTFAGATGLGSLSALVDTSDANGLVSTSWTLGSVLGAQTITANYTGLLGGALTLNATALPPSAAQLAVVSTLTTAIAGTTLPPFVVEVRDAQGVLSTTSTAPVSISLDAGVTGVGMSGTLAVNAVAGVATFSDLSITQVATGLTITATSGVLTGATSGAFSITAAGPAALEVVSGNNQTGALGELLPQQLVVRAVDAFGNRVPGVDVTFGVSAGGGSLEQSTIPTDPNGEAANGWTLGTAGAQTVRASISLNPDIFADFTANGLAGPAAALQLVSVPGTTIIAGSNVEYVVRAIDSNGNLASDFAGDVTVAVDSGPATAALGGTTTVAAVAGVATFNAFSFSRSGSHNLVFSASGLTPFVMSSALVLPGAATELVVSSGDAQSGTALGLLAAPVVARLVDALGNGVPGATVNFAITTGGGSLLATSMVTDVDGLAQTSWTLGATIGTQTMTASSANVGDLTFTATAIAVGPSVWTGAISSDWATGGNWSTGVEPAASDDVTIPTGTPFSPSLLLTRTVNNLLVATEANLDIGVGGSLNVNGNIDVIGNINVLEPLGFNATGVGRTMVGRILRLNVLGSYSLVGEVQADYVVSRGTLTINGQILSVSNDLELRDAGVIVMQNPADQVLVNGNAIFAGGSTEGLMTTGVLFVAGDLRQEDPSGLVGDAFAPSGSHVTRLISTVLQQIDILNSGTGPGSSHFANLNISQGSGSVNIVQASRLYVEGQLTTNNIAPRRTITSIGGGGLTVNAVDVNGLTLNNVPLVIGDGGFMRFDNVGFEGMDPATDQLTILHPGTAAPFAITGISFADTPTGDGVYLRANDTDGAAIAGLVINVDGATPVSPAGLIATVNGAVINWPMAAPIRLWTGNVSSDWSLAENWENNVVPSSLDSVAVPAALPNNPQLVGDVVISGLRIDNGAALALGEFILNVIGDVDVPAVSAITAGLNGAIGITNGNVRGAFPNLLVTSGTTTLNGTLTVAGDLSIMNATLQTGAFGATVGGSLMTGGTGALAMAGPSGVTVEGDAIFAGGSSEGLLTGGTLTVRGDFTQVGPDTRSFNAGNMHIVDLAGAGPQTVMLTTPDLSLNTACAASCFGTLRATRGASTGSLTFDTGVKAVTQIAIETDALLAIGQTLVSGGSPEFITPSMAVGSVAFQSAPVITVADLGIDTLVAFGSGAFPAGLNFPTIVAGNYTFTGAHNASMTIDGGMDIVGTASIAGDMVTRGTGRIVMQQVTDSLTVSGSATFGGQTGIGQLTQGMLNVGGNFAQTLAGGLLSYGAEGTHKLRLTGASATVSFADASVNHLGALDVGTASGTMFLTDTRLWGTATVLPGSGPVAGVVGEPVTILGDLVDATGGLWQVPTTRFENVNPLLPLVVGGGVQFAGDATLLNNLSVNGDLDVTGTAALTLNGNRVSVLGAFSTTVDGTVVMQNAADALSLSGNATFGGFNSTGLMTDGRLELYGNFTQTGNPSSFAPSGLHSTHLFGMGAQSVSFADATNSFFNNLTLEQGDIGSSVNLLSDLFVNGSLTAFGGAARRFTAAAPRMLTSRGGYVTDAEFSNVRWSLLDGAVEAINNVRFTNQDPTVVQLSVARSGGTLSLGSLDFQTVPTTGRYLTAEDTDGAAGGLLVVAVSNPLPAINSGFIQEFNGATITGWPAAANLVWTGAANNIWSDVGNWEGGVVPVAADSVYVGPGVINMPTVSEAVTLRALVSENPGPVTFSEFPLTITDLLAVPTGTSGVSCVGANINLTTAAAKQLSGRLECDVNVSDGVVTLADSTGLVGSLYIGGTGRVVVGGQWLYIGGLMDLAGSGVLEMTNPADTVIATGMTFGGGDHTGALTAGSLTSNDWFVQSGAATAFVPSGTHRTTLAGGAPTAQAQLSSAIGLEIGFAELSVSGYYGMVGAARVAGDLIHTGELSGAGRVRVDGDLFGASGSSITTNAFELGGVFSDTGSFSPDTVVFTGSGQSIPFEVGSNIPSYNSMRVTGTADFLLPATAGARVIAGDLIVDGQLGVTSTTVVADLQVGGDLFVRGAGGRLLSSGLPHTIGVLGSATFDGALSDNDLSTGVLRVTGSFTQLASTSARSFRPAPEYVTSFEGSGTLSFADPVESRFGGLEIRAAAGTRTLLSDVDVAQQLRMNAGNGTTMTSGVAGAGGNHRVTMTGFDNISGVNFENVSLRINEGLAVNMGSSIFFTLLDPEVVQLEFNRDTGFVFLVEPQFYTVPTGAGLYLRANDSNGATGGPFTVQVSIPNPTYHGGLVDILNGAALMNWAAGPEMRWTGVTNNDWNTASNWAGNTVPASTDSVYIGASIANSPMIPLGGVAVRAFVSDYAGFMNIGQPLTVTERFVTPLVNGILCDGGTIDLLGGANPVLIAGSLGSNCVVRVLSGTAVADGRVQFAGDMQVQGEAIFAPNKNTVVVSNFSTMGGGRLRMDAETDSLIVGNGATFDGGSTAGMLTDGVLRISGNFTQGPLAGTSPESFAASGNHVTVFAGTTYQQAFFISPGSGPGASHFGHLELSQGEVGFAVQLTSAAYAEGQLRTGAGVPAQQLWKQWSDISTGSEFFQSRGSNVNVITFNNVTWTIADGAPIAAMDNITFNFMNASATFLSMERAADLVTIRNINFVTQPVLGQGIFLRLSDLDGNGGGLSVFGVTMETPTPGSHNNQILIQNLAQLFGWFAG